MRMNMDNKSKKLIQDKIDNMYFDVLSKEDVEEIRIERNKITGTWRTNFLLTAEMQEDFYNKFVNNRNSNSRFWSIRTAQGYLLGMAGTTNISLENRNSEVNLFIMEPGKGFGEKAFDFLLDKIFYEINLENLFGECYYSNSCIKFWEKMIEKYNAFSTILPKRKYYNGTYYDSLYFNFNKSDYVLALESVVK